MVRHMAFARAALVAGCCLAPLSVAAQTARGANEGTAIDELIVIARKQGETLLDAPATISVVQQDAVQAANITNANQLNGIVPGLVTMQGTVGTSASVRGVGSSSADPSTEPSVATFVDGVYLGHPRDFILPIYDVAQIELIKGTQSTLLGKNTSLGAVSITNRRPGADFSYDISASLLGGIDAYRLQGGVDVPLTGGFVARVAGFYNNEGGYVRNLYIGDKERRVDEFSGRLTLTGPIGEAIDTTLIYQHDDRITDGHYFEVLNDPTGVMAARARALGQPIFDTVPNDISYSGSDAVGPGAVPGPLQFDKQRGDRITFIGTAQIGDLDFTAQTGWVQWKSSRSTDFDLTRARLLELADREKNAVFSQELRLASPSDDRLSWLVGLYYYNNRWGLNRIVTGQTGGGVYPLSGGYNIATNIRTEAWSGFGSARFAVNDQINLSAGLRYTDETKTATYARASSGTFAAPSSSPPIPHTELPSSTSRELDGDIGLQYRPNETTMLYATWSRGSKSGGYQTNPQTLAAAPYDGETAYTAEVGAKLDLTGSSYVTAAVFNTYVKDFQVSRTQVINGLSQAVIANADVRTRGAEVAGAWSVTDSLTLNGNVVYADAKFAKDFPPAPAPMIAYEGMPLPRAPKLTARFGAEYLRDLTDDLELRLQGSASYTSDSDLQFRSTDPLSPIAEAHWLLDAQVAIGSLKNGWEVSFIGTNLADERYVVFATNVSAGGSAYYGNLNRPRTVAVQLRLTR